MPNFLVVDLSHHNRKIDFVSARAAGVVGIIHKASQGTAFTDPTYSKRRKWATDAGLLWGACHFGTSSDVAAQLENFIDAAALDSATLVALDLEENVASPNNSMSLEQARTFLATLDQRIGRKAVLYGGAYLKEHIGQSVDPFFAEHRLWCAQYSPQPEIPAQWQSCWLWQHTDGFHGSPPREVPGLGTLDCDTFEGTEVQLRANW